MQARFDDAGAQAELHLKSDQSKFKAGFGVQLVEPHLDSDHSTSTR